MIHELKNEIHTGLSATKKYISSKFFYDEMGSQIFKNITQIPEYYLTNSEHEILLMESQKLWQHVLSNKNNLHVIELGPGDGSKIQLMFKNLPKNKQSQITYHPFDISSEYLQTISQNLPKVFPNIAVHPIQNDYFQNLEDIQNIQNHSKLVLFLGSNIGNFSREKALKFLNHIRESLTKNDYFMIGLDLKKNPFTIKAAYDDPYGVTKQFNLNLLKRINRELGGHFELTNFDFYVTYCPTSGEVKSYLVSLKNQKVPIDKLEQTYEFYSGEAIQTEISKKYDQNEIVMMAKESGFEVAQNFFDCKGYFVDSLWKPI